MDWTGLWDMRGTPTTCTTHMHSAVKLGKRQFQMCVFGWLHDYQLDERLNTPSPNSDLDFFNEQRKLTVKSINMTFQQLFLMEI